MKIAFDGQLFLKGNKTGIAWYAHNIVKELSKISDNDCICNYFSKVTWSDKEGELKDRYKGIEMQSCTFFDNVLYKMVWPFIPIPYRLFFKKKADVTLFFNYALPPGVKGKKVVVVYDMAYKTCPATVRKKTRYWLNLMLRQSCRRADLIVTISEFSKSEIIKYLGIPEERIIIIPCGVDKERFHTNYTIESINNCMKKYGIKEGYLLYLGTLEPRKNIDNIIKAYALLKNRRKISEKIPQLVLAGGKGWYYESIFELVKKLQLEKNIIFTGYVSEEEVPLLMSGAHVFVFPSLYEGFGMPPLEAMACGTPVVTSNAASLPEVVGDAGICVDPFDVEQIASNVERLLYDEDEYKRFRKEGLRRVEQFDWHKIALRFNEKLKDLV